MFYLIQFHPQPAFFIYPLFHVKNLTANLKFYNLVLFSSSRGLRKIFFFRTIDI